MIGHTIPAAGVAGLIKTALALHHRVLPPTLHCEQPNPELGLERTPFYLNTETRPWIHGALSRGEPPSTRSGSAASTPMPCSRNRSVEQPAEHRPPWESEVFILEGRLAAGTR